MGQLPLKPIRPEVVELVVFPGEVDPVVVDGHVDLFERRALAGAVGALARIGQERRAVASANQFPVPELGSAALVEANVASGVSRVYYTIAGISTEPHSSVVEPKSGTLHGVKICSSILIPNQFRLPQSALDSQTRSPHR